MSTFRWYDRGSIEEDCCCSIIQVEDFRHPSVSSQENDQETNDIHHDTSFDLKTYDSIEYLSKTIVQLTISTTRIAPLAKTMAFGGVAV